MRVPLTLAAVALAGLALAACSSAAPAAPAPPTATVTTVTVAPTPPPAVNPGDLFLSILGPNAPTSRSMAVRQGEVLSRTICSKIKYNEPMIAASLLSPLYQAGYGYNDVKWILDKPQEVTNALGLSFCNPNLQSK